MEAVITQVAPVEGESRRIAAAVAGRGWRSLTVVAYLRLQDGSWWEWLAIFISQIVRHAPVVIFPLLQGRLIDAALSAQPRDALGLLPWVLGATALLCLGNVVGTTTGSWLLARINRGLSADLREALLRRLNRLTLAFHDRARSGDLQNRFLIDIARLEALQGFIKDALLMHVWAVAAVLVIAWGKNPAMAVVIAAIVPINLLVARVMWSHLRRTNRAYSLAESTFLSALGESLLGLRTVRALAAEERMEARLATAARVVARRGMRLDVLMALFGSSSWAVSSLLQMVVIGLGVVLAVLAPEHLTDLGLRPISIGDLTVLLSFYVIASGSMGNILATMPAVAAARESIRSLGQLWEAEVECPRRAQPIPALQGTIAIEGLGFRYPGNDRWSLRGIDLQIPAGTSLALVGASGSGKSTLAALVLGFYEPQEGGIRIDGRDLNGLDLRGFRRQCGVVGQEVVLFRDSILTNIAFGDPAPNRPRAREAARRAQALEFIDGLPGGLDHLLRDRGAGLSGGQRQRLAIARALYRDPRLLVLDEATSALDPASERAVQGALDELR